MLNKENCPHWKCSEREYNDKLGYINDSETNGSSSGGDQNLVIPKLEILQEKDIILLIRYHVHVLYFMYMS